MIINTDAIVLHRMKYKNSGLIARIFTKEHGKISIIVNGASKQKGNMFGVLEPPNIIKLNYYQKKTGTLQICKEASFISNNLNIKTDLMKLSVSLTVVEIIDKTLHENDVNNEIYECARKIIDMLDGDRNNPQILLSYFLLNMITELGFKPDLNNNNTEISNILKIILRQLDEAPNYDFSYFNNSDIEWMDIIIFLENYIQEHLKLTQKFKSLDMIRNIAYE